MIYTAFNGLYLGAGERDNERWFENGKQTDHNY